MNCKGGNHCAHCLFSIRLLLSILKDKSESLFVHSVATATVSRDLAVHYGFCEERINTIYLASLLHDIGKFFFPDEILFSSKRLSKQQLSIVRQHPERGARIIGKYVSAHLAGIVLHHHELPDGSGYPHNLGADDIPLESRILAIADKYTALIMHRKYRQAVSHDSAVRLLDPYIESCFDGRSPVIRQVLDGIDSNALLRETAILCVSIENILNTLVSCG